MSASSARPPSVLSQGSPHRPSSVRRRSRRCSTVQGLGDGLDNGRDPDDGQQDQLGHDSGQASVRRSKKPRVEDVHHCNGPRTPTQSNGGPRTPASPAKPVRDVDGFLPGSIVRVELANFVTYENVTFHPCAHLNMIIGPNGTGKSTLVCAIALGLGYQPSVLERAPELRSFIKHGAEHGSIEVELKGHPGKKNVVIKLHLVVLNNSRVFEIDGVKATISAVQDLVRSFNIQVDNLCCFLPQEKVANFSDLKEPELLKETQKVAGHPQLSRWHGMLIKDGKVKLDIESRLGMVRKSLNEVEKQLHNMQADVDRLEARKRLEVKVQVYQLFLEEKKYLAERARFNEAKLECVKAADHVAQLEEARRPVEQQQKLFESLSQQYSSITRRIEEHLGTHRSAIRSLEPKLTNASERVEEASERLGALKEDERRRKARRVQLSMSLEELAKKIECPVPEPDLSSLKQEMNSISAHSRRLQREVTTIKERQADIYGEREGLAHQQAELRKEIDCLRSVSGQQEADMQRHRPNVVQALQIMRSMQQQGKFVGKVYEPIRLSIAPKAPEFAMAIEGCISRDILNAFLCSHPADYDLLASECNDKLKLRIDIVSLAPGASLSNHPSPLSKEKLHAMGFEHFLIDLVHGPDQVLAFLCQQYKLHLIPFTPSAGRSVDESQFTARNFPIKAWVIGSTRYQVHYSAYGKRESFTKSSDFSQPKILNVGTVDEKLMEEKNRAMQQLASSDSEKQSLLGELKSEESRLRQEYETNSARKGEIETQIRDDTKPHIEYLKNRAAHASKSKELKLEDARPTLDQERKKRKIALRAAVREKSRIVKKYVQSSCQISQSTTALLSLRFRVFQHETNFKAFKRSLEANMGELATAKQAAAEAAAHKKQINLSARQRLEKLTGALRSAPTEVSNSIAQFKAQPENQDRTADEVQQMLDAEQEELEISHPVDPGIVDRYRRLKDKMDAEKKQLDSTEAELSKVQTSLTEVYNQWRPYLDELVQSINEKFDQAFKRMGCLGSIVISEDPDFDKWGIEIRVSFRDGDKLMRLDSQRQSGGERSLSTIMYLMSLTSLGKAPFSLVDEINQGMDRDYERAVHDQLVELTCQDSASQYFLITPKLLLGLNYHPLMRVLCVNNGDWLQPGFKFGPALVRAKAAKLADSNGARRA